MKNISFTSPTPKSNQIKISSKKYQSTRFDSAEDSACNIIIDVLDIEKSMRQWQKPCSLAITKDQITQNYLLAPKPHACCFDNSDLKLTSGLLSDKEYRTKETLSLQLHENFQHRYINYRWSMVLPFVGGMYICDDFISDSEVDIIYFAVNTNRHHCESNMDYANPEEKCQ